MSHLIFFLFCVIQKVRSIVTFSIRSSSFSPLPFSPISFLLVSVFFYFVPRQVASASRRCLGFLIVLSGARNDAITERSAWARWLGSRAVSVLDSGAEGPGFKSLSLRCRVTVLGKLFTPILPLFTKQRNW